MKGILKAIFSHFTRSGWGYMLNLIRHANALQEKSVAGGQVCGLDVEKWILSGRKDCKDLHMVVRRRRRAEK